MPTITAWIEELAAHLPALKEIDGLKNIRKNLLAEIDDLTTRRDAIQASYKVTASNEAREALLERETQMLAEIKAKQSAADEKLEQVYAETRAAQVKTIAARDELAALEARITEAKRIQAALRQQLKGDDE